jgi:hypothetical protein
LVGVDLFDRNLWTSHEMRARQPSAESVDGPVDQLDHSPRRMPYRRSVAVIPFAHHGVINGCRRREMREG